MCKFAFPTESRITDHEDDDSDDADDDVGKWLPLPTIVRHSTSREQVVQIGFSFRELWWQIVKMIMTMTLMMTLMSDRDNQLFYVIRTPWLQETQ